MLNMFLTFVKVSKYLMINEVLNDPQVITAYLGE